MTNHVTSTTIPTMSQKHEVGEGPRPEPTEFVSKNRKFLHLANGWCVREITVRGESVFRLFYGVLQPGSAHPGYVNAYREGGGHVEFPDLQSASRWLDRRRGRGS